MGQEADDSRDAGEQTTALESALSPSGHWSIEAKKEHAKSSQELPGFS